MEFANQGYLYLLLIIPAIGLWYWYRYMKDSANVQLSNTEGVERTRRSMK
jgi:hypothetical protein